MVALRIMALIGEIYSQAVSNTYFEAFGDGAISNGQ